MVIKSTGSAGAAHASILSAALSPAKAGGKERLWQRVFGDFKWKSFNAPKRLADIKFVGKHARDVWRGKEPSDGENSVKTLPVALQRAERDISVDLARNLQITLNEKPFFIEEMRVCQTELDHLDTLLNTECSPLQKILYEVQIRTLRTVQSGFSGKIRKMLQDLGYSDQQVLVRLGALHQGCLAKCAKCFTRFLKLEDDNDALPDYLLGMEKADNKVGVDRLNRLVEAESNLEYVADFQGPNSPSDWVSAKRCFVTGSKDEFWAVQTLYIHDFKEQKSRFFYRILDKEPLTRLCNF
jgi:hypothetical protein